MRLSNVDTSNMVGKNNASENWGGGGMITLEATCQNWGRSIGVAWVKILGGAGAQSVTFRAVARLSTVGGKEDSRKYVLNF